MRTIRRGGEYLRVADPDWLDPLDPRHAQLHGGRWNPPDSFPVVYMCGSVEVARANVYRKLEGQPYGPEDLDPRAAPVLVATRVREDRFADLVTGRGLASAGLPATYPLDSRRRPISWSRCQPIGLEAWGLGHPGIACRSAAQPTAERGEELAWFQRGSRRLRRGRVRRFDDWFW